MTDDETLEARLASYIGRPMSSGGPTHAPDAVNVPMIRHWVDAMDDRNPIYLDTDAAAHSPHGTLVAPPAMLQTWTMGRPIIDGLAERGGSNAAMSDSAITVLDAAGYTATRATNSELEFERYLVPGDELTATSALESVSDKKTTGLGTGYFITWVTTYTDQRGDVVGRQRFRILKFRPNGAAS